MTADSKIKGLVFNIQRYSVHDGAGIRTNVFLKGCPLRCRWCSNPESQEARPELARNEQRCLGAENCAYCSQACLHGALALPERGIPVVLREKCRRCMGCAERCPAQALLVYGQTRSVQEVLDLVEQDGLFYARSGGGLTLSGGEPLLQAEFTLALLREARARHIRAAMETCGHAPWKLCREACALLDELFFDIKTLDPAQHKEATGADNKRILANLRGILEHFPKLRLCVRTPVIPGLNDRPESIRAIVNWLRPWPQVSYELLPYHRLGAQKYRFLDRPYPLGESSLSQERLDELTRLAAQERPH